MPKAEPVAAETESAVLKKEIAGIADDYLLFSMKNYDVYCSPSVKIPNVLNEIGRLRELTFRAVGEGTNRSIDLDEFDLYYYHLFIWDKEDEKIVGAYRVGKGKEIIDRYGIKGFYIHTLFKMRKEMLPGIVRVYRVGTFFYHGGISAETTSLVYALERDSLFLVEKSGISLPDRTCYYQREIYRSFQGINYEIYSGKSL